MNLSRICKNRINGVVKRFFKSFRRQKRLAKSFYERAGFKRKTIFQIVSESKTTCKVVLPILTERCRKTIFQIVSESETT